ADELAGMHVKKLVHEDEREAFGQSVNEMKRVGRIDDWEVRLSADSDIVTPASISALVCEHREGDAEIRWLVRDLTVAERDRLDLQRMRDEIHRSERLTAIGTLAAGLGHDVKNLLLPMR